MFSELSMLKIAYNCPPQEVYVLYLKFVSNLKESVENGDRSFMVIVLLYLSEGLVLKTGTEANDTRLLWPLGAWRCHHFGEWEEDFQWQ